MSDAQPDGPAEPASSAARLAATRSPHALRRHQAEALEALAATRAAGRTRAWVALPPGAGKTLVGLETVRREQRPALVLCPNTAVQGQWVRAWGAMRDADGGATAATVSTERDLAADLTVLTYQALAVFRSEQEEDTGEEESEDPGVLDRLHPNGRALVERLRGLGPVTLVLDECHHLVETWGRLLAEVLDLLPDAVVLGLTATPPTAVRGAQAALVDELFGDIAYAVSVPAVVREGHLAPFTDLVWLTTPTAEESEWLAGSRLRFTELVTALTDPSFGSTPFLTWVDRRFAGDLPFDRVAASAPALGDAALRLRHAGLLRLRDTDHVHSAERHRRAPDAEDWGLLVDDWYDGCLLEGTDPADEQVREALRRALPAVGWQVTRRGLRRGRSPVDRVLARSAAKSRALVEIVSAEHRALGERLRMLVVCDHERATATVPADLHGVVSVRAGSARLALADLLADPVTAALDPVLVTGRTVAAAPATLERLRARVRADRGVDLVVGPPDDDGAAELAGAWTSRTWVRAVSDLLADGGCRVLVGTRALLGEGWDAPALTGLVDLGTATTATSVVQTRGRSLRLDPADPDKVAVNWTVCAVAPDHPRGGSDWQRTVAKHQGYLGVDATGEVVDGVAHIHPSFSPWSPPDAVTFDAVNASMLLRAERRHAVAEAWAVGSPYDDVLRVTARVTPSATLSPVRTPAEGGLAEAVGAGDPPDAVVGPDGVETRGATWPAGVPRALTWVVLALTLTQVALSWVTTALGLLVLVGLVAHDRHVVRRRREVAVRALRPPDLLQVAAAVADGLRDAGLASAGSEAVRWRPDADGAVRVRLDVDGRGPDAVGESERFAEALAEVTGAVEQPRYLVPRYTAPVPTDRELRRARTLGALRPAGETWHAVPTVLGVRRERADAFAAAWDRWVGGRPAVLTADPRGAGALAAARGADPLADGAALRTSWH
ncbi:DEAD/DEAH box helicase family protein [uncultured Nocardioides sp.]|uniref:DEAD/DEAH box helicase family protein n=1 Tax=uncultured Nocardioides sp. TaxID=198441 RepID=UPI002620D52A|nr:DEAD/DEAH box helicase family protein [uncultured Nocardioides sp.]